MFATNSNGQLALTTHISFLVDFFSRNFLPLELCICLKTFHQNVWYISASHSPLEGIGTSCQTVGSEHIKGDHSMYPFSKAILRKWTCKLTKKPKRGATFPTSSLLGGNQTLPVALLTSACELSFTPTFLRNLLRHTSWKSLPLK